MTHTLGAPMASLESNTIVYYAANEDVAQFVSEHLNSISSRPVLTITINPVKSEGYCVVTVISSSLEDTPTQRSSKEQQIT